MPPIPFVGCAITNNKLIPLGRAGAADVCLKETREPFADSTGPGTLQRWLFSWDKITSRLFVAQRLTYTEKETARVTQLLLWHQEKYT